jgi:Putative prokaryotic signal transducing protein
LKRVASSYNLQLVHHWRNVLDAAGIRAVVKNEILSSAMGELPPAECQAEVWVLNEADAARAASILQGQVSGADWTCACGEKLGPQFTQCWRCSSYRPAI